MNTAPVVLLALSGLVAFLPGPAVGCTAGSAKQSDVPPASFSTQTALIEQVITASEQGARFRAFIVVWNGSRVLVSDPLARTPGAVGDRLRFLVSRHEVDGRCLLALTSLEDAGVPHEPTVNTAKQASSTQGAAASSATATVDDVLSARDGDYRFVAYLVKWHGSVVAIEDPLSESRYVIGDRIDFTALRAQV